MHATFNTLNQNGLNCEEVDGRNIKHQEHEMGGRKRMKRVYESIQELQGASPPKELFVMFPQEQSLFGLSSIGSAPVKQT